MSDLTLHTMICFWRILLLNQPIGEIQGSGRSLYITTKSQKNAAELLPISRSYEEDGLSSESMDVVLRELKQDNLTCLSSVNSN